MSAFWNFLSQLFSRPASPKPGRTFLPVAAAPHEREAALRSLRAMGWRQFEEFVAEAYRRQGCAVEKRGGNGPDGGVDLVLTGGAGPVLIQCKRWKTWSVGVSVVRELYGVMAAGNARSGIVVTSGAFTEDARAFSCGKPLTLLDGPAFLTLIHGVGLCVPILTDAQIRQAEDACPLCGEAMALRTARQGSNIGHQFRGCTSYPRCRGKRAA